jgi:alkanesulfonate monooxygenase SsuD/methylene tetrahydromethanopterin reductase-like flavin-dependent oxidoreductase (luciferase family)
VAPGRSRRRDLRWAVGLGWHSLPFEALLELTRRAEALGFEAVFADGDVSMLPGRADADVLDGLTVTTELLARTERIEVGSLRLVHHWNAAHLAQTLATLWRLHPGRVRLFVSIGGQPADRRFGWPVPRAAERIEWLDETLEAVRALWRGEEVRRSGRHVRLDGARVRPAPGAAVPIHVAGRGARLLRVVARHADAWDINLPPVRAQVALAERRLARACRAEGRDPGSIARSLWIFARPGRDPADPSLHEEFLRLNPWFAGISAAERAEAIAAGSPGECRRRIVERARGLGLDLPVVDLSGTDPETAARALEALAPKKTLIDPAT